MLDRSPISRFENFARTLIEGSVDRLLGQKSVLVQIGSALAACAATSRQDDVLANRFVIRLHPETEAQLLHQSPDAALLLEDLLLRLQREEQLILAGDLEVKLIADDSIKVGKVVVSGEHRQLEGEEATAVLNRRQGTTAQLELLDAYLIVGGRRHVVLRQVVTSIGRSLENDIVLDDPDVSRRHAQIRWRHGRFVLFDLSSRAGSFVNDLPVQEHELASGDVILLGGAAVVYGEGFEAASSNESEVIATSDITQELVRDDLP